ncbi:MAG: hypothetical protein ACRDV1_06320, partial [Actinomycetes bacterium]
VDTTYVPAAGTATGDVDPSQVRGARPLDGGGWVVPVRGARPAWASDDLLAAAAKRPTPAPKAAVAPDAPLSGYVGIRPGSQMIAPYGCTMNFVFVRNGTYAIGTAGHCVDKVGQPVTLLTIAPGDPVNPDNLALVEIGTVISRTENGVGADFALVSIKPALQSWVFPTIPAVGGPCGAYTGNGVVTTAVPVQRHADADAGETIFHYGHGLGIGSGGTPRTGHALYWEAAAFWWQGTVVFGDSGSAARVGTTGLGAAGDVTHLIVLDTKHLGVTAAGTRISKILSLAGGYSLVSSTYCV